MLGMIPLVMNGKKYMTTRLESEYRLKLDVGDTMYIYSGIRTKNAKKHGEAVVVKRWRWNQIAIHRISWATYVGSCPIGDIDSLSFLTWEEFSKVEGFNNLEELITFFNQKRYLNKDLITYQFEVIK
jgi:hypothetical protein